MNQTMSDDPLAILLESEGWEQLRAHVDREWGSGGARFEAELTSLADPDAGDALLVSRLRQIAVARREILRVLQWPTEELARRAHREDREETPHALAGRRGRL